MSASVARKWIELSWLRKGNKQIPLPEIIFEKLSFASGCCYKPVKRELQIDNRFWDLSRGLIIVDPSFDDRFLLNGIAHEWRHHWQHMMGINVVSKWVSGVDYKKEIIRFFTVNLAEMDALIYSIKKAPDDLSILWYEWIIKSRKETI